MLSSSEISNENCAATHGMTKLSIANIQMIVGLIMNDPALQILWETDGGNQETVQNGRCSKRCWEDPWCQRNSAHNTNEGSILSNKSFLRYVLPAMRGGSLEKPSIKPTIRSGKAHSLHNKGTDNYDRLRRKLTKSPATLGCLGMRDCTNHHNRSINRLVA